MPGPGDPLGDIFRQAQKVQREMARIQEDLKDRVVEGSAGGGAVTALANGQQEVMAIRLKPEVVDPAEVEMLQDLVVAAVNTALKKARDLAQKEIGRATGGLVPPGMM